ncbi:hypothetical protein [Streptococcus iners]|uniref:CpsW n=2 Tax=Streptococcus TaxID=1301 RepID=A0A1P8VRN7_STRSU|nr:hypothetical protein [Streptococcus sp. 29892]APZ79173.1 cpsW'' [Streptococcus suis]APZ79280.1 cpsW'' [Streptococcus suis]MCK4029673.1 hypothetical protein [Streptococcus suis]WNY48496.1 hypothetical protein PW220_07105 [Streptococcus sp. 29892]HEM2786818.1 hypothetical protein [Streptococcus suis]
MVDQWLRNASNHFGELESSYIRGRRRGKEEGRLDVAYQMLREGFSNEMIEKLTGLSSAQIEQLSQNHQV